LEENNPVNGSRRKQSQLQRTGLMTEGRSSTLSVYQDNTLTGTGCWQM